jgi:hypothetical protein
MFDDALVAGASQVVTRAALFKYGIQISGPINFDPGATVTLSETTASRRTFSGTLADDGTLAPHLPSDPLAPYGVELQVETGLVRLDGTQEVVPAGVFRLDTVDTSTLGQITLSGPDRSAVVSNASNEKPFVIPGGTPVDSAIEAYLAIKYPAMPFLPDSAAHSLLLSAAPTIFQAGTSGDPFADCIGLANQFGRELFIDALGNAVLRPIPDPATQLLTWQYQPGQMNLATIGTNSFNTTSGLYNVVVVSSSGSAISPPIVVSVQIEDPASPIYPDPNGFGRRPYFYSSTEITTVAQATATGLAILNRNLGVDRDLSFSAVPHPAHEPGDVVTYTSQALGVSANVCLSAWTMQLDLQKEATYQTRQANTTLALP